MVVLHSLSNSACSGRLSYIKQHAKVHCLPKVLLFLLLHYPLPSSLRKVYHIDWLASGERESAMVIAYQKEFGQKLDRWDRYNGNPSWIQTVIREYELELLGPQHLCETSTCDCVACWRYRWLEDAHCQCELKLQWGKSTG